MFSLMNFTLPSHSRNVAAGVPAAEAFAGAVDFSPEERRIGGVDEGPALSNDLRVPALPTSVWVSDADPDAGPTFLTLAFADDDCVARPVGDAVDADSALTRGTAFANEDAPGVTDGIGGVLGGRASAGTPIAHVVRDRRTEISQTAG